ncbi:hypothetical protein Syun_003779 [Stephania yunnanensis]|uniref:Uncharacterized protein n=1 Tax=Stephania yunnanensis TaxID=152371 RepID=A0AAP0Q050_9MAGN
MVSDAKGMRWDLAERIMECGRTGVVVVDDGDASETTLYAAAHCSRTTAAESRSSPSSSPSTARTTAASTAAFTTTSHRIVPPIETSRLNYKGDIPCLMFNRKLSCRKDCDWSPVWTSLLTQSIRELRYHICKHGNLIQSSVEFNHTIIKIVIDYHVNNMRSGEVNLLIMHSRHPYRAALTSVVRVPLLARVRSFRSVTTFEFSSELALPLLLSYDHEDVGLLTKLMQDNESIAMEVLFKRILSLSGGVRAGKTGPVQGPNPE